MPALDNAQMAIDANFDVNGFDATYYSVWPGSGLDCRVIPAQPDIELGLEIARIQVQKSQFMLRACEGVTPAKGGYVVMRGSRYRIEELPQPDDLRLVWRLSCVKAA